MTFVEAAIEVLKREGKPLSTRRLAELAVKLNLLSVVGRDPESTMQQRLEDALGDNRRHPDLVRLNPDTFGLHAYPPQPYPANGAQAHGEAAAEEKRPRRRRGRRADDGEGADETAAAAADEGETEGEGEGEGEEGVAAAPAAAEAGAPAGEKRRRRRRGGRGRRRREGGAGAEAPAAEAKAADEEAPEEEEAPAAEGEAAAEALESEPPPPMPDELPTEAAAAGTPADEVAEIEAIEQTTADELLDEGLPGEELGEEVDEIDEHTGPLLAPALGAEDVTRTEDDRTVRPEIRGSRDERRRHDRHKDRRDRHKDRKGEHRAHEAKGHEHKAHEGKAHEHKAHEHKAHEGKAHEHKAHEHKAHERAGEPRPSAEPRSGALVEALLDLLRGADGRPMHVRHLVDTAVKKRALDDKTQPADLVRLARAALVRELRDREADGLRPRVRALGGGNYGTVDKKLDPELLQAERELGSSAGRLRDATRAAVRRRLGRMAPAAFDALGRTLADKLGITGLELLRRGEGVTYWGGTAQRGVATARVLLAFRPGEGEINRRAVGELRAGLAAKGYDEGLLFASGRPNAEALAELKQGGVTLYDGAALATLLVKHGLGVRRVTMPVDYLDLDFFGELNEG
jgi:hypothetical protein